MTIAADLFAILRETPEALTAYAEDFLVHDMDVLKQAKLGDQFIWAVREHGTHLWPLGCDSSMAKAVLDTSRLYILRLVTVTQARTEYYPCGDVSRINKEEALELITRRAATPAPPLVIVP
jgi:hypothetical protein